VNLSQRLATLPRVIDWRDCWYERGCCKLGERGCTTCELLLLLDAAEDRVVVSDEARERAALAVANVNPYIGLVDSLMTPRDPLNIEPLPRPHKHDYAVVDAVIAALQPESGADAENVEEGT
jgi:hypothetical protein